MSDTERLAEIEARANADCSRTRRYAILHLVWGTALLLCFPVAKNTNRRIYII